MHAFHHLDEVDGPQLDIESEMAGPLDRSNEVGGIEKDLRRDAPAREADTARFVFVDDRNLNPWISLDHGLHHGHDRSRADRDDVVLLHPLPLRPEKMTDR